MPYLTWPSGSNPEDLPANPTVGYQGQYTPALQETAMRIGPPKVRRLGTMGEEIHSVTLDLTTHQYETLREFIRNLHDGVDAFVWKNVMVPDGAGDPIDALYRFDIGRGLVFRNVTPGVSMRQRRLTGTINLRFLGEAPPE